MCARTPYSSVMLSHARARSRAGAVGLRSRDPASTLSVPPPFPLSLFHSILLSLSLAPRSSLVSLPLTRVHTCVLRCQGLSRAKRTQSSCDSLRSTALLSLSLSFLCSLFHALPPSFFLSLFLPLSPLCPSRTLVQVPQGVLSPSSLDSIRSTARSHAFFFHVLSLSLLASSPSFFRSFYVAPIPHNPAHTTRRWGAMICGWEIQVPRRARAAAPRDFVVRGRK